MLIFQIPVISVGIAVSAIGLHTIFSLLETLFYDFPPEYLLSSFIRAGSMTAAGLGMLGIGVIIPSIITAILVAKLRAMLEALSNEKHPLWAQETEASTMQLKEILEGVLAQYPQQPEGMQV